ncbi:MAG: zf-TFIIB domain-containing protein [Patescibacteria group bacterium]|nr:zf-TFIIB domain-containing protein [Patescibacteria group bacterium]
MKCPDCNNNLKKVKVKNDYGIIINLDQCSVCGGIWFDNVELYPILKEEIERIENLDIEKLQENVFIYNDEKKCPVCKTKLQEFKDFNFPKQLEVEYCIKCNGFWMNRGEATDFKKWQSNKRNKSESEENLKFRDDIRKILGTCETPNYKSLGEIGKFLSTPLNTRTGHLNMNGDKKMDNSYKAVTIVSDIFQLLLRLFLNRI